MPHKRAKRSVRERQRNDQGEDLAPAKLSLTDEPIPKSLARVLNAAKIREEWKVKKRKREDTGGITPADKRRKLEEGGKSKAKRATSKLTIKPGESIQHFNRRVEDDMRPLVKAAVQSSNAVVRSAHKAEADRKLKKGLKAEAVHGEHISPVEKPPQAVDKVKPIKDFQQHSSSAPRRLNDVVQAPPEFKKLPRGAKATSDHGYNGGGGKREGVLSMAQKQMMEEEREKAIARYRELKANRHRSGEGGDERDRSGRDED